MSVSVGVTYSVDASQAQKALTRLEYNLSNQSLERLLHDDFAVWLQHRAEGRFGTEGDEVVGKWQPLQLATLLIRARQGFPTAPINVRTGQMKAFLTGSFGDVNPRAGGILLEWPSSRNYGTGLLEKLQTAQFGRDDPPTVARPVAGVGELDSIYMVGELTAHLMSGL